MQQMYHCRTDTLERVGWKGKAEKHEIAGCLLGTLLSTLLVALPFASEATPLCEGPWTIKVPHETSYQHNGVPTTHPVYFETLDKDLNIQYYGGTEYVVFTVYPYSLSKNGERRFYISLESHDDSISNVVAPSLSSIKDLDKISIDVLVDDVEFVDILGKSKNTKACLHSLSPENRQEEVSFSNLRYSIKVRHEEGNCWETEEQVIRRIDTNKLKFVWENNPFFGSDGHSRCALRMTTKEKLASTIKDAGSWKTKNSRLAASNVTTENAAPNQVGILITATKTYSAESLRKGLEDTLKCFVSDQSDDKQLAGRVLTLGNHLNMIAKPDWSEGAKAVGQKFAAKMASSLCTVSVFNVESGKADLLNFYVPRKGFQARISADRMVTQNAKEISPDRVRFFLDRTAGVYWIDLLNSDLPEESEYGVTRDPDEIPEIRMEVYEKGGSSEKNSKNKQFFQGIHIENGIWKFVSNIDQHTLSFPIDPENERSKKEYGFSISYPSHFHETFSGKIHRFGQHRARTERPKAEVTAQSGLGGTGGTRTDSGESSRAPDAKSMDDHSDAQSSKGTSSSGGQINSEQVSDDDSASPSGANSVERSIPLEGYVFLQFDGAKRDAVESALNISPLHVEIEGELLSVRPSKDSGEYSVLVPRSYKEIRILFDGTEDFKAIDSKIPINDDVVTISLEPKLKNVLVRLTDNAGHVFSPNAPWAPKIIYFDRERESEQNLDENYYSSGSLIMGVPRGVSELWLSSRENEFFEQLRSEPHLIQFGAEPQLSDGLKIDGIVELKLRHRYIPVSVSLEAAAGLPQDLVERVNFSFFYSLQKKANYSGPLHVAGAFGNSRRLTWEFSVPSLVFADFGDHGLKFEGVGKDLVLAEPSGSDFEQVKDAGGRLRRTKTFYLIPRTVPLPVQVEIKQRKGKHLQNMASPALNVWLQYTAYEASKNGPGKLVERLAKLAYNRDLGGYAPDTQIEGARVGSAMVQAALEALGADDLGPALVGQKVIDADAWGAMSDGRPVQIELERTKPMLYAAINPNRAMEARIHGVAFADLKIQFYRAIASLAGDNKRDAWSSVMLDAWYGGQVEPTRIVDPDRVHDWSNPSVRDQSISELRLIDEPIGIEDIVTKTLAQTLDFYDFQSELPIKVIVVYLSGGQFTLTTPKDIARLSKSLEGTGIRVVIAALARQNADSTTEIYKASNAAYQRFRPADEIESNFVGIRRLISSSVNGFLEDLEPQRQ
jgi:hypothetical protein